MLFARFHIELWALRRFVNRKWNLWKQLKARIATNVVMLYTILDKMDIYENTNDQILTERNIHRSKKNNHQHCQHDTSNRLSNKSTKLAGWLYCGIILDSIGQIFVAVKAKICASWAR